MAKKNSSKTATEKSLQAANPRIQVFDKWAGVNFKDAPLGWEVAENKFYPHHQTDLPLNNWLIQNNMVVDMSDSVSTRYDAEIIAIPLEGYHFTGVACLYKRYFVAVLKRIATNTSEIYWHDINSTQKDSWTKMPLMFAHSATRDDTIEVHPNVYEIDYYENVFIALTESMTTGQSEVDGARIAFTCEIPDEWEGGQTYQFKSEPKLGNPALKLTPRARGMRYWVPSSGDPAPDYMDKLSSRFTFVYTFSNKWGSTLASPPVEIWTEYGVDYMTSSRYIQLSCPGILTMIDKDGNQVMFSNEYITGIDIWVNADENQNYVLIAHVELPANFDGVFNYRWFGTMTDTDMYSNSRRWFPQENSTFGPIAEHLTHIDSRIYYWGDPDRPYRLLIGGNVGNELAVGRGFGGGWIDIEPGSGYAIKGVTKWKTASGANIVTILCGNPNTNQVKRFNLVELTASFTTEITVKGWQYEEVSNVVGCNSRWGYGVFQDGLYSISRYGLMLTTMTAEYNNQMKNQKVSEVIDPIFTERLGNRLNDARLVHIDGIAYIVLSEDNSESTPQNLDRVILCYDIGKKAWYTFTHGVWDPVNKVVRHEEDDPQLWDDLPGRAGLVLHAMAIDSEEHVEGLGIITEDALTLYPTTGIQDTVAPKFDILLESGELCSRVPMQSPYYVEQLEFRFDYFIGRCELEIEGVDYYGRKFKIWKVFGNEGSDSPDTPDPEKRAYVEWVRVQKLVEFFRIRIKGKCRCRLTHIIAKAYLYNNLIGMPYGFDAQDTFINRHGDDEPIHHYIDDYNNLRRAIVT